MIADIPTDVLKLAGAIGTAIIGVAIVAVIVSKNATTPDTINAAGGALSSVVGAAVAPVSSGSAGSSASTAPVLGDLSNPAAPTSGLYSGGYTVPGTTMPYATGTALGSPSDYSGGDFGGGDFSSGNSWLGSGAGQSFGDVSGLD
jgi:hypothetical protein